MPLTPDGWRRVRETLGLPRTATPSEVVAAVRSLKTSSANATARQATVARQFVELAVTSQRLRYTQRAWALEFAGRDPQGFFEFVQQKPPAPSFERQILDAANEKVEASRGALDLRAAINEVGREHPDLMQAHQTQMATKTRTQLRRIS